jgi:hypothetical protein
VALPAGRRKEAANSERIPSRRICLAADDIKMAVWACYQEPIRPPQAGAGSRRHHKPARPRMRIETISAAASPVGVPVKLTGDALADFGNAMTPVDIGPPRLGFCICRRNHTRTLTKAARRRSLYAGGIPPLWLSSNQVHEHGRAGFLSLSERLKRRAADLMARRTPGCHETGTSMKAGTAAALKADYERKAVAARGLFLQIHGTDDAAELHDASDVGALAERDSASLSRKMQRR